MSQTERPHRLKSWLDPGKCLSARPARLRAVAFLALRQAAASREKPEKQGMSASAVTVVGQIGQCARRE